MVHWLWGRYLTVYDCLIRTTRIRVCTLGYNDASFFFPLKSWHTGTMCSDTSKKTKMRNVTTLSLHKWMFSHWWASVHVRLPVHSSCMVHWLWGRYLTGYDCLIRTTRIRVCIWDYNDASCFYPGPVLAFGYCRCLRLSVCPSVCAVVTCLSARYLITRSS